MYDLPLSGDSTVAVFLKLDLLVRNNSGHFIDRSSQTIETRNNYSVRFIMLWRASASYVCVSKDSDTNKVNL